MTTDTDIRKLARSATDAEDDYQWALCMHALGELDNDLYGAPLASMTPEEARAECGEAIEEAAAAERPAMITDTDIRQLARAATDAGDLLQWALCAHALGELDNDLYPAADAGTDAADVLADYTTEEAWTACADALDRGRG